MIFSSSEFFVFLAVVLGLLALLRGESARRNTLLVASYIFYGWWDWRFCGLMFGTTAIDYYAARWIERAPTERGRRIGLVVAVVSNLGVLVAFKYTNFFIESLQPLLESAGIRIPHLAIVLPVGISFFTFQAMSYVIDVYRGELRASRSLRDLSLFIAFFPQLIAGPIVRGSWFMPQLDRIHPLSLWNIREGTRHFFRGFMKKVLFADTLAVFVDHVWAHPGDFTAPVVWLAVVAYAGQIYYDFSGYSDMAVGLGRMLGFEFPVNFRHPYRSLDVTEFWRRWHITLSTWLRDYLYIPLGGNRKGRGRTYANLAVTMLLGGLWHGAAWTFVVWGALHGAALALHKLWLEWRGPQARPGTVAGRLISWAGTFLFVLVTWVFFRSPDFQTAAVVLRKMAFLEPGGVRWFYLQAMVIILVAVLLHVTVVLRRDRELLPDLQRPAGWVLLIGGFVLILMFAPLGTSPFIYFQF